MTSVKTNQQLTRQFRDWLTDRGRSASTVDTYTAEVERLAAWVEPESLADLRPAALRRYFAQRADAGDSPATHNVRLAAIRQFCRWLVRSGTAEANAAADIPARAVAGEKVECLSRSGVRALLAAVGANVRDRTVLLLVLSTGVRVGELVRLNRADLKTDGEGSELAVRTAEGSERTVYPSAQATESLREYLGGRDDECEAMFVSRAGGRLAARTVQTTFARYFRRAGIPGSMRTLRHTFAVHRSQSGMDVSYLQDIMGLKSPQSARIYRQADPDKVREVALRTEERY